MIRFGRLLERLALSPGLVQGSGRGKAECKDPDRGGRENIPELYHQDHMVADGIDAHRTTGHVRECVRFVGPSD